MDSIKKLGENGHARLSKPSADSRFKDRKMAMLVNILYLLISDLNTALFLSPVHWTDESKFQWPERIYDLSLTIGRVLVSKLEKILKSRHITIL